MAGTGGRLRELVEHVDRAAQPEASLRALTQLRAELDAAERFHAARALAGGSSFGSIARALGISRQAAHRRYRTLAGAAVPAEPQPQGRVLITSEARTAVEHARREAAALGARAVGSEHLLLGVLNCGRSPVGRTLRDLGVELEAARRHAQPTGEARLPQRGADGVVPPGPQGITSYAKRVFERALRLAVSRGDGFVGVEHLLLAALEAEDGGAARTLEALNVRREAVEAALERAARGPAYP